APPPRRPPPRPHGPCGRARARAAHAVGSRRRRPARGARGSWSRVPSRRHHDAEDAALARATLYLDPTAVVGHDTLRDGETETGALPRRLGREERIEDPAEDLLGHARPLVRSEERRVGKECSSVWSPGQ